MKGHGMSRRSFGKALLGGAVLLAAVRPAGPASAHSYKFDGLAVGHLYAPPTGTGDLAVYGPLVNMTKETLRLTGARVANARRAGFRRVENGKAVWLDALDLQPNKPLALAPWREHLWVEGLPDPLKAGDSFDLTLEIEGREPVAVSVVVEEAGSH